MKIQKEHKRNTLMHWRKEDLVEHILCLEHNVNVLHENFEQQYKNCLQLLDDMALINETLKRVRKKAFEIEMVGERVE